MDKKLYDAYIKILEEELVPAMGCTEPIAIAYGAALARETLGEQRERQRKNWRCWRILRRKR